MTDFDQHRITERIGDAFAILCARIGGVSATENKLRLGFEAILRQLGTPPLRVVSNSAPPPFGQVGATSAELRFIIHALDCCLAIFKRYDAVLTTSERKTEILVRATRRFADEELRARQDQAPPAEQLSSIAN